MKIYLQVEYLRQNQSLCGAVCWKDRVIRQHRLAFSSREYDQGIILTNMNDMTFLVNHDVAIMAIFES